MGGEPKTCDYLAYIMGEDSSGDEDLEDMGKAWKNLLKKTFAKTEVDNMLAKMEYALYPTLREGSDEGSLSLSDQRDTVSQKHASNSTSVFGRHTYRSQKGDEDECQDESKRLFNFDFGSLDAEVNTLKEKLDSMTFCEGDIMEPLPRTKSLYDIFSSNIERAGVKTLLNRIALVLEMTNDTNCIEEGYFSKMVARTDVVFAKELGQLSGFLLAYPFHTLLLIEGPEISIADVFMQFSSSPHASKITKGKVLMIATDVLVRYVEDWSEVFHDAPSSDQSSLLEDREVNECLVILGNRCRRLWRKIRREKMQGPFTGKCLNRKKIIPEVELLNFALNCNVLRPYHTWLKELTGLCLHQSEEIWPEPTYLLPTMAHKKDPEMDGLGGAIRTSVDPLDGLNADMDLFLSGASCQRIQFFRDGTHAPYQEPQADEEDVSSSTSEDEADKRPLTYRHRLKDTVYIKKNKKNK